VVVETNNRKLGELVGNHVRIKKRGKFWQGTYQHEGKQIRVSFKTTNKKQAIAEATKINLMLDEWTYQPNKETKSVAEAIKLYLEVKTTEVEKETVEKYTRDLNRMLQIAESQRRTKLCQIDLVLIDEYKLARRKGERPVELSTIFKEVMTIRGFVNWCLARKLIKDDPLAGLRFSQPKTKEQPWWIWEVVHTILQAISEEVRPAYAVLAYTGMRSAELQWLTWDDVDLKENRIHIRPKEGWAPKSEDERVVPIMKALLPYLRSLPKDCKWVIPMPRTSQQWVSGKQLSENALYKRLKRVLAKLGLEGHVHTFRHSFISYCVYRKIQEAIIRSWVGHVDAKIMRRYTHIHSKHSQEAMSSLSVDIRRPTVQEGGADKQSA